MIFVRFRLPQEPIQMSKYIQVHHARVGLWRTGRLWKSTGWVDVW